MLINNISSENPTQQQQNKYLKIIFILPLDRTKAGFWHDVTGEMEASLSRKVLDLLYKKKNQCLESFYTLPSGTKITIISKT